MTTQSNTALMPIVSIVNNAVTALSTDVAKYFGKNHFHVVRDIEELIDKLKNIGDSRASNFGASEISIASNLKNAPNKIIKAYRMTRDGFMLLVMGWTGEKALQFKCAWLDAFNAMEKQLYERNVQQTTEQDNSLITSEQQYEISSHVMRKTHALFGSRNYSAVYRALKRRFRIPRYTCLLNRDYETALKFIDNLTADDFSLPDMPEEKVPATPVVLARNAKFVTQACKFSFNAFSTCEKSLAAVPAIPAIPVPVSYSITESEMKAIKAMVYYFDDLFKPLIKWAEHEAFKQNHPLASRFYDVWHEPQWFLGRMKRIIERNNA